MYKTMKISKYAYLLIAASMLGLSSCDLNDQPSFSDSNAFVAFTSSSVALPEESADVVEIPVMLTSLAGIETTCDFKIVTPNEKGAVANKDYKLLNESNTLTFTKKDPVQYIRVQAIDNDEFTGDKSFIIKLSEPKGVKLGASKSITVTVGDDEHPLSFMLGGYSCAATSNFGGDLEWEITIEKDADDLSKVWISNMVPGASSKKVYGVVSDDHTELNIPAGQEIMTSSSYPLIALNAMDGETEESIPAGSPIKGKINEDGTITIQDYFGSQVFSDAAGTASLGWYEIVNPGAVFTKK